MMALLELKNLEAWYGSLHILHGVNIQIKQGDLVSIIGPNGAGKSTTLKAIFNLVPKRTGEIRFNGTSITALRPDQLIREGIAYVPQGRSVFPSLSVDDNLVLGAYTRKDDYRADLQAIYEKFPRLHERRKQRAGLLSGGEQQMLSIGRALMTKPKLLLLDEPSLGLDPKIKKLIFDKIVSLKEDGITVLTVEQNARLSLSVSDYAYVLELGKNKLEGTGKKLLHDKRVQHLYLGGAI